MRGTDKYLKGFRVFITYGKSMGFYTKELYECQTLEMMEEKLIKWVPLGLWVDVAVADSSDC